MNHAKRLVVTDQAFGGTLQEEAMARACGASFHAHQCVSEEETHAATKGAEVVLNNFAPMTRAVLSGLAKGAVIIRYGVGVDNVDLEAARDLGVHVCNVPDYGVEEVADHAAAMSLALARRLPAFEAGIRTGGWRIGDMAPVLPSLRDTTVGLIGLGRIARSYAARMAAFGCRLIGHDPYVDPEMARAHGIDLMTRDEVIGKAGILSLHVPLSPATRHMLDAAAIARMPAGAILVNASRGGLVDEEALAEALRAGRLGGAGLDVFEVEPLPAGSALREAPNVLMSPHAAFFSQASVAALQRLAAEEAGRALRGEALRCALT